VHRAFGNRSAAAGVAIALSALVNSSWAQEAPLSMLLTCTGQDKVYQQTGETTTTTLVPGVAPTIGSDAHRAAVAAATATTRTTTSPNYGFVAAPARLSLAIEGAAVRIRPSPATTPMRRSADGWYALTDVAITDGQIRAKATWGAFGKLKLEVDRRTGDVKFGDFRGACEKTADAVDAKKF
jgi:hypothetical protein